MNVCTDIYGINSNKKKKNAGVYDKDAMFNSVQCKTLQTPPNINNKYAKNK